MVDLNPLTAIFKEIGTSRFPVAILFVDIHFPDMRLSLIVPVSNSALAWYPFTITYASSVICSVPLGVTQLEKIIVMELSSSCSILNALFGAPLSKHLALG
jgi:hypothetical protein